MSTSDKYVWFITGYVLFALFSNLLSQLTYRNHGSANRGIGLEMTKQLLQSPGNIVLAACRNPSKADALQGLTASAGGRLHVVRLDVNDIQSVEDAAREAAQIVGEKGIDYLINNAGVVSPFSSVILSCSCPSPFLSCSCAEPWRRR